MPTVVLVLVQNVALIVLLATIVRYVGDWRQGRSDLLSQVLWGLLFGGVGVAAMMSPVALLPGLIFDGRSVILSIAGMFGGPIPATIAALACGLYRYSLGGVGTYVGLAVIIESASLGVVFYYLRRRNPAITKPLALWAFGVLVHVAMLGTQLFLPGGIGPSVVAQVGPPVLVLFPLALLLLARLLLDQEHRAAEERRLVAQEERLRLALESGAQGLYDLDLPTGQAEVSPGYSEMLGYEAASFAETHDAWLQRLHPDDVEPVSQAYKAYINGDLPEYRVEFRQRTASGDWKWILSLGRIVERDSSGKPTRMLGTHTDISAIKDAEKELRNYRDHLEDLVDERTAQLALINARLEEATNAKTAFLASMSHELRTPLNSIIGFSDLLSQGMSGTLTEEQQAQVVMINSSGRHLLSLIEDVLDIAKVESGKEEMRISETDIDELVRDVADMVRPLAEQKGLSLEIEVDSGGTPLVSDAGKIKQILLNLAGNAVKFTSTGQVAIRVRRDREGGAIFSVEDTGPGIAPDDQAKAFETFTQIGVRDASKPKGTGLGLALARQHAHLLGGEVSLTSEVERGSTFELWVPNSWQTRATANRHD